jgi:hypothetical protein
MRAPHSPGRGESPPLPDQNVRETRSAQNASERADDQQRKSPRAAAQKAASRSSGQHSVLAVADAIREEDIEPGATLGLDKPQVNAAWKDLIDYLVGQAIRSLTTDAITSDSE